MVKTYESRMVKGNGPGRPIYDRIKLLPEHARCPFCDHRNVSSVDHILPKTHYPIFAVTPVNLVGCCDTCNKRKSDTIPTNPCDTLLHPYFDEVSSQQGLIADVIEEIPAALTFDVIEVFEWSNILNQRLANQFSLLGLADLYSSQAAHEITNIRHNLQRHFDSGGPEAVREELQYQWESRQANRINSWQTATYQALMNSSWFYSGGFAET